MSEAQNAYGPVISTRNGVPPKSANGAPPEASDPPGGIPRTPDPDTRPHPDPREGGPAPADEDLPDNEPSPVPPRREAQGNPGHHRSHHRHK